MNADVTLTYNVTIDQDDYAITDDEWNELTDDQLIGMALVEAPFLELTFWDVIHNG